MSPPKKRKKKSDNLKLAIKIVTLLAAIVTLINNTISLVLTLFKIFDI